MQNQMDRLVKLAEIVPKLHAPARYELVELLEELKFGCPGLEQEWLDKKAKELKANTTRSFTQLSQAKPDVERIDKQLKKTRNHLEYEVADPDRPYDFVENLKNILDNYSLEEEVELADMPAEEFTKGLSQGVDGIESIDHSFYESVMQLYEHEYKITYLKNLEMEKGGWLEDSFALKKAQSEQKLKKAVDHLFPILKSYLNQKNANIMKMEEQTGMVSEFVRGFQCEQLDLVIPLFKESGSLQEKIIAVNQGLNYVHETGASASDLLKTPYRLTTLHPDAYWGKVEKEVARWLSYLSNNRFLIQKWEQELGGVKPNSLQKVQTLVKRLKIIASRLKWQVTDKQKQEIIARYSEGESVQSIARSLGVSQPTLSRRLKEWGIEVKDPTAKKLFTDEQVSDAIARYSEGESALSISKSLGVSLPTLIRHLKEWGIKTRNPTVKKESTYNRPRKAQRRMYMKHLIAATVRLKKVLAHSRLRVNLFKRSQVIFETD